MKIDLTTITGYDQMTQEQKLAALESYEYEPAGEDAASLKRLLSDRNSQIKSLKDEMKARMSEAERQEAERQEKEKADADELERLRRRVSISDNAKKFLAKGFAPELAEAAAEAWVDGNLNTVLDSLGKHIEGRDRAAEAARLKGMGKPASGGLESPGVTKEQFDKMGYSDRVKLYNENPELYKQYTK